MIGYISTKININDKIMLFADDTTAFTVNKELHQLKYHREKIKLLQVKDTYLLKFVYKQQHSKYT